MNPSQISIGRRVISWSNNSERMPLFDDMFDRFYDLSGSLDRVGGQQQGKGSKGSSWGRATTASMATASVAVYNSNIINTRGSNSSSRGWGNRAAGGAATVASG